MDSLLRVLRYAQKYWVLGVLAIACMLATSGLELLWPQFQKQIIDRCLVRGQYYLLPMFSVGILGLFLVRGLFMLLRGFLSENVAQRTVYDIRSQLFDHIQRLSFTYHDKAETGQLISRATSDVDAIAGFLGGGMLNIVVNSTIALGIVVLCIQMNWKLALIALSSMPFLVLTISKYNKIVGPMYTDLQDVLGKLTTAIQQNVMGIKVVKAFAREDFEIEKFEKLGAEKFRLYLAVTKVGAFYGPLMDFIAAVGTTFILWYGGMQVLNGSLTLGELVLFNTYLTILVGPVSMAGWVVAMLQNAIAAADRVFEVLNIRQETHLKDGTTEMLSCKGHVEFKGVGLSYQGGRAALSDINFDIQPGEMVALIGPTGSGKSSIINLIPRFYDVTSGAVMIDGVDVRDYRLATLRHHIGIVAQETFLFNSTIKENISFGRPSATMEEIEAVAKAANIHDFIMSMHEGYDSMVGERGTNLSGGQKQRLSIARALLKNPPILILDDSTSALDTETELLIQKALVSLTKSRTTFVIAQRISTVKRADKIIVLDGGKVVEMGTHEQLVSAGGLYSEIFQIQLSGQESGAAAVTQSREAHHGHS